MKRIAAFIISVFVLSMSISSFAETNDIEGFDDKFEDLLMKNYFSQEQLESMHQERLDDFNDRIWAHWLENIRKEPWDKLTENEEEEYDLFYNQYAADLNYNNGAKINFMLTNKYIFQYAEEGLLKYLLSDKYYWVVQNYNSGTYYYDEEGNYQQMIFELFGNKNKSQAVISKNCRYIFESTDSIKEALINKGETKVNDIKLFFVPYPATILFLYITTPQNEYLVKMGICGYDVIENMEYGRLYTIDEMMAALADTDLAKMYPIKYEIIELAETEKNIYEAEAESLQQQGLLQGNENGLDLLKPLTRAEAVTLLIRAMGLEDQTSNYTVSQFADIASDNWASPYAALAKAEGITNGVSETEFAPDDPVTADQFATFVLRAAGESNFDYTQGIQILIDRGIITAEESETMDLFTRGDMAKIIYEAKEEGLL